MLQKFNFLAGIHFKPTLFVDSPKEALHTSILAPAVSTAYAAAPGASALFSVRYMPYLLLQMTFDPGLWFS